MRKPVKKVKAPESIPDDASFIASLKERQKESEVCTFQLTFICLNSNSESQIKIKSVNALHSAKLFATKIDLTKKKIERYSVSINYNPVSTQQKKKQCFKHPLLNKSF